jgi:hypothetical protein
MSKADDTTSAKYIIVLFFDPKTDANNKLIIWLELQLVTWKSNLSS